MMQAHRFGAVHAINLHNQPRESMNDVVRQVVSVSDSLHAPTPLHSRAGPYVVNCRTTAYCTTNILQSLIKCPLAGLHVKQHNG